jgi:mono/diheme cytochrome c family protein
VTLDPLDLQGSDPVEVGRNLVRISRCQGCHTAWEAPRMPGYFAGGNIADLGQGPTDDPEPQGSFTSNLTPHASGLSYDAETFTLFMRTGRGGSLSGAMPWTVFRHLSDSDLGAIYTFLRTLHPVAHHVNNIDEPTFCVVCEQVHGGGALNEPYEPPPSLTLTTSDLERYAGTFHASEYDWTVELSLADGRLLVRVDPEPTSDGEPGSEAIVLTRTRLLIPDEGAVDVELDSDSIAARLITVDADAVVLERVR